MSTRWIVVDDSPGTMAFEHFQGHKIFRPQTITELAVRHDVEAYLRQKYDVGMYTEPKTINAMLQRQFAYLQSQLLAAVTPLAGRDAMSTTKGQVVSAI